MSLKKNVNEQFIYLNYIRQGYNDFVEFKREVENVINNQAEYKDIVIDFTGSKVIYSSEISLIVRILNSFKGTARFLRVVSNPDIHNMLMSTNINQLENFSIYNNQKAFAEQLKGMLNK